MLTRESDITVWGVVTVRTHRVHWALHELGLKYQTMPIQSRSGETKTETYTALNPKQKIPFLQDGGLCLSESPAIVAYLFRQYGEGCDLYRPDYAADKARIDEWNYFAMMELDAHTLYVIRRHEGLPEIYGAAPLAVASARDYCAQQLTAVADKIAAADPYLFGEQLSTADILLTSCLDWAQDYGISLDGGMQAYRARINARPAYDAAWKACAAP